MSEKEAKRGFFAFELDIHNFCVHQTTHTGRFRVGGGFFFFSSPGIVNFSPGLNSTRAHSQGGDDGRGYRNMCKIPQGSNSNQGD
jgi:hypothetical protein